MATAKKDTKQRPTRRQLHWLTLYEGPAAKERTRELGLQVARNVEGLMGIAFRAATLTALAQAEAVRTVTRAALVSDVILVSIDEAGPALDSLQQWMGAWSGQRARTDGLFALWLGPAFASQALPLIFQQSIAREVKRAGMEWVCRVMGVDTGNISPGDLLPSDAFNPLFDELSNPLPPPSHWGINE